LGPILGFFCTRQSLLLENLAPRQQLTVLKLRPTSKIFITELASELKIHVPVGRNFAVFCVLGVSKNQ